ncbi:hypothetical protein EI372_03125 [Vibrio fluvialis]|nr:hypothetical protein [Vibrio fluvialis]
MPQYLQGSYAWVRHSITCRLVQTRVDTLCLNLQTLCQGFHFSSSRLHLEYSNAVLYKCHWFLTV